MPETAFILKRLMGNLPYLQTDLVSLSLYQRFAPTKPVAALYELSLGCIVQGRKRITLGRERNTFEQGEYVLTSLDLPVKAQVLSATASKPYLALLLKLDLGTVRDLLLSPSAKVGMAESAASLTKGQLTTGLQDALDRLLLLLDTPEHLPILGELIRREITYHLLVGPHGSRLREIALESTRAGRTARAVKWLNRNYRKPLNIPELAEDLGIAESTLHHNFRALTGMSPLQYQKELRLREARRLLLSGDIDAGTAALQVGYESPTQFNREYRRVFGLPPMRDIKALAGERLTQGGRL